MNLATPTTCKKVNEFEALTQDDLVRKAHDRGKRKKPI